MRQPRQNRPSDVDTYERWLAEERFVDLSCAALVRRHPQSAWLAEQGRTRPIPLTDRALAAAADRLAAWLEEHEE